MVSNHFLSRWSKRKIEGQEEPEQSDELDLSVSEQLPGNSTIETESVHIQDSDESVAQPQSIASLLASQAAKETKKAALRKLFLSGEFSEVDRLNDYDHDYSSVKPLASEVAEQLRQWWSKTSDDVEELSDDTDKNSPVAEPSQTEKSVEQQMETELSEQDHNDETKNTT